MRTARLFQREPWRINTALFLSLLVHSLLLSIALGGKTFGLPGLNGAHDLRILLAPARLPVASILAQAMPDMAIPEPAATAVSANTPSPPPIHAPSPTITPGAPAEPVTASPQRPEVNLPVAPNAPQVLAPVATVPQKTATQGVEATFPSNSGDAAQKQIVQEMQAKAQERDRQNAELLRQAELAAEAQREARQQEVARAAQLAKSEAARLEAERVALAQQEAIRREAQQEAARQDQAKLAQLDAARKELERAEATRLEGARNEAARQEKQRLAQLEATRLANQDAARRELERAEAARLEGARNEAARLEKQRLAQLEATRLANQDAARRELERAEAVRLEAARQEQARQAQLEAARRDAMRKEDAIAQEAARQSAAKQDAARQEQARLEVAQREKAEQEAKREERLRAIGRELNEEAAQRNAAANNPSRSLLPTISSLRRGWLLGRADPNADLVTYAEGMSRKIEKNITFETIRETVKQPHVRPMVTVAIRADGSVEKVVFVVSSGIPAIDEMIRKIVSTQAPYGTFPPALARQYDVIEIRRTWIFDMAIRLE